NTVPFNIPGTDRAPAFPHMDVDNSGGPSTGNIYITWQSNRHAMLISSYDGGNSWNAPVQIDDDGITSNLHWFPTVNVDVNGNVHSFFYDRRDHPGTTITNLYYAVSTDGGQTFQPNLRASDTDSNFHTFNDGSPAWGDYINATTVGTSAIAAYADGRLGDPDAFFSHVGNRGI
ncbi:MAG TPA: hypothetical protein VG013_04040, partial [Gemmataceae bacterium]|nr:hypothetical protein [Gemmataceae bacterium]